MSKKEKEEDPQKISQHHKQQQQQEDHIDRSHFEDDTLEGCFDTQQQQPQQQKSFQNEVINSCSTNIMATSKNSHSQQSSPCLLLNNNTPISSMDQQHQNHHHPHHQHHDYGEVFNFITTTTTTSNSTTTITTINDNTSPCPSTTSSMTTKTSLSSSASASSSVSASNMIQTINVPNILSPSSSSSSLPNPSNITSSTLTTATNTGNTTNTNSSSSGGGGGENNPKLTPQKSVCFHSITGQPGLDKKITNAIDCLQYMINGTTLIKVKASMRQYRRFYSLEEDLSMIRWIPSTKKTSKARLPVKNIREVRRGKNTDVLKNPEISSSFKEECAFSIIYGEEFESIDLIALSSGEANIWVTGLNFLIGLIRSPDSLEGRERMREKWLLDVFDEADSDHKGMLDELEIITLLKKLNERLCIDSLKQKILEFELSKKSGEQRGCISKDAFISLFTQTATRPDVYFILVRYCGRDYMTIEELQLFLEGEQGLVGTSLELCQKLIERYEPSDEARQRKQLLIDGFTQFLMSEACDVFGMQSKQINHDMNHPLADYFISSSYNTYLIEDQLKGPSSCEGYVKALLSGCRCVKIDVHDGQEQPLVFHSNTLTSKIPLADVLTTIRDNAFISSPYPVIIHLENHCSLTMQREVAQLFRQILGDYLFLINENCESTRIDLGGGNGVGSNPNVSLPSHHHHSHQHHHHHHGAGGGSDDSLTKIKKNTTPSISSNSSEDSTDIWNNLLLEKRCQANDGNILPLQQQQKQQQTNFIWSKLTPNKLMYKIIITGKKISNKNNSINSNGSNNFEEVSDNEEESQSCRNQNERKKFYLCQELSDLISMVRIKVDSEWNQFDNPNLVHLNESDAIKLIQQQNTEELTQRNKHFMTEVTPDVSRVDSSNLNPLDFWYCGIQLISMNYQTNGQIMNLYKGWFSQNGSCGYVLKPSYLREKHSTFNLRRWKDGILNIDPLNIRIKIISGQQLPRPKGASLKANSIDPYIIVQCLGMPIDCAEARTSTVSNDGSNPIFDESFEFNVCLPELTMIRFLVLDDDFINDDFIGQLTVPVSCLKPGYKHVKLLDMNDEIIPNSSLFIKIAMTQRYGSKQKLRRKKSWNHKNNEVRQMGIKHLDEQCKMMFTLVCEATQIRKNVEKAIMELCDECSLPESANMAQCLRIITLRMATCPSVITFQIVPSEQQQGFPHIKVAGELTTRLNRTITILVRTLQEIYLAIDQTKNYIILLTDLYKKISNIDYQYENYVIQCGSNYLNDILLLDDLDSKLLPESKFDNNNNNSTTENMKIDPINSNNNATTISHGTAAVVIETSNKPESNQNKGNDGIRGSSGGGGSLLKQHQSSSSSISSNSNNQNNSNNQPNELPPAGGGTGAGSGNYSPNFLKRQHSNHSKGHRNKNDRIFENLLWNLSIIKQELDNLHCTKIECENIFKQIERISESLERIFEREHKIILRSNSYIQRELDNVNNFMTYQYQQQQQQQQQQPNSINLSDTECNTSRHSIISGTGTTAGIGGGGGATTTGTGNECQLRSILKKTSPNSSMKVLKHGKNTSNTTTTTATNNNNNNNNNKDHSGESFENIIE